MGRSVNPRMGGRSGPPLQSSFSAGRPNAREKRGLVRLSGTRILPGNVPLVGTRQPAPVILVKWSKLLEKIALFKHLHGNQDVSRNQQGKDQVPHGHCRRCPKGNQEANLNRVLNNIDIIESICKAFPRLEIWLDTGLSMINDYLDNLKSSVLRLILSTESVDSLSTFTTLINNNPQHQFIFSIDYISGEILGPHELLQSPEQWPADILILNLDHVGSNQGISIPSQLNQYDLFQSHNIFYGGGIRNYKDLRKLKTLGATGALVSSALHNKAISKNDLLSLSQ